jgi:transcriptional regulator with XRE-family HTH domain
MEKDPTLVKLGKNLQKIRKAYGQSQERLAFEAEIDRTYVSQIERGIANPSIVVLKRIAASLDAKLSDLVSGL